MVPGRRKKSIFCVLLDAAISLLNMIAQVLHLSGIVTFDTVALMPGLIAMAPWSRCSSRTPRFRAAGGWSIESSWKSKRIRARGLPSKRDPLELIQRQPNRGIHSAKTVRCPNNDLHDRFRMSEKGRMSLVRLAECTAPEEAEPAA